MRFFIALEIPQQSKKQLAEVQKQLKQIIPIFRPSDNDKLHITFAFIGDKPDDLKQPLIEVLNKSAEGIPPFSITPGYIDGFPHLHTAKILWIGVKGDIDKLLLIRHRVKDGLAHLNLNEDERRFIPHIALGKVSNFNISPSQELELQKIESQNLDPINVESIKLFESIPEHGLHKHNTLAEIKLV